MQDQRIDNAVGDAELCADRAVLDLVVDDDQSIWSVDELAREFGAGVDDSLARLFGAGLVHRLDGGFVVASRRVRRRRLAR